MDELGVTAPVLLGSTLVVNEEEHEHLKPLLASCGSRDIDLEVLEGGFRYGEVTTVAGAPGTGKTTLAYHLIASHLIADKNGHVALIATTDPPLVRLRDVLISRLARNDHNPAFEESGYVYKKQSAVTRLTPDIMQKVSSMLERVRISRVFDFPGLAEALSEFGATVDEDYRVETESLGTGERKRRRSIADSEDNSVDDLPEVLNAERPETAGPAKVSTPDSIPARMIIVDNIANVVGSMMTKSQVQGHALLASFMRCLHHLTKRRHICTLLLNAVVGLHLQSTQYHRRPDDQVSVFASVPAKPALGKHFSYLVDTSIFLAALPRSKDDADVAYGDACQGRKFEEVRVIEVLKDRYGGREGRWSPFTVEASGDIRSVRL
ncbi:MAG: hypothetical protein Q9184_000635 [Pyrenodesmia sp. 2 TL-2023]